LSCATISGKVKGVLVIIGEATIGEGTTMMLTQ